MSAPIRTSTPVATVIRLWPSTGRLVALLPELPGNGLGTRCLAVEQGVVEDHEVEYDYDAVIERTLEPETRGELAGAKRLAQAVVQRYGYSLRIVRRATDEMHQNRRRTATNLRHAA